MKSCTMFAVQAEGNEITTVEGLRRPAALHPVQEGFQEEHGLQCGFCTPGMMLTAVAAGGEPRPHRGGDPLGDLRQHLPVHGLPEHRQGRPVGGGQEDAGEADGMTDRRPRGNPVASATPSSASRTPASSGARQLRRGRGASQHAPHGDPAQPVRPRDDQVHRHARAAAHRRVSWWSSRERSWPQHNLAWMPTLSGDTQAVLATDKVRFQGQEVAWSSPRPVQANDALELIDVDYEPLQAVTSPQQAMAPGAPVIRDDKEGQTDNRSTTGSRATPRRPSRRSRQRTRSSASTRTTRGSTRRRSSAAAASPTSTRRPARCRST